MRKLLALLLLLPLLAHGGTVTGNIQTASSGAVVNGTLTFTLNQFAVVSGTAQVVATGVQCYTSTAGAITGEPDPQTAPVLSVNLGSGTLAAGTYFLKYTYFDGTGESLPSPEASVTLVSPGTVIVAVPAIQPANATGWRVYISAATGTETRQSSQTGFAASYQQTAALSAGTALPGSNTSACSIRFTDEMIPSTTYYTINLVNAGGSKIAGYPISQARFYGGTNGSVNVSSGWPVSIGGVIWPSPIVSTPNSNSTQSIAGGLNLGAFPFLAGSGTFTGINPLQVGFCDKWIAPSQNIQTVLNTCPSGGTFTLTQGVYAQGANHITLKSGQVLRGAGQTATVITCTGTGPCIGLDSTTAASVQLLQVQIDTTAGASCFKFENTIADSKWNIIFGTECQTTSGTLTAGQEGTGLYASTAFAMYWNFIFAAQTLNLDTGFHCTITGAGPLTNSNGCNDNFFIAISCHFFTNCWVGDKWATENRVIGITASASGNVANSTLVKIGNGVNPADNNMIYLAVADTGAPGQSYQILAGVARTLIDGVVDAGGRASTNASASTMVKGFRNASSQADLYPNGTCASGSGNPPIGQLAAPSTGLLFTGGGSPETCVLGFPIMTWTTTGSLIGNTMGYGWAGAADPNGTRTTNLGNPCVGCVSADTTTVGNEAGYWRSANTVRLVADFTDANASGLQVITGLSFALPTIAKNWSFSCHLMYSQATPSASDQFGVASLTTAPTNMAAYSLLATNATAVQYGTSGNIAATTPTAIVTFTPAVTTVLGADLNGSIEVSGSGASTLQFYVTNGTAANVIVIKRDSYCRLY